MVMFSENLLPLFCRNKQKRRKDNFFKKLWWVQIIKKYKWKSVYCIP